MDLEKGPIVLVHTIFFVVRRFILALIVVTMRDMLFAQICLQSFSIIAAVIVIGYAEGKEKSSRITDTLNELTIMFVLYCTMCFSPFVPDIEVKFKIGYLSCFTVSSHLVVNLAYIIKRTIKMFIYNIRVSYAKKTLFKMSSLSPK